MESIKYISDILAARDRLLATFKQNEANVIEYLYKKIGNAALPIFLYRYSMTTSESRSV